MLNNQIDLYINRLYNIIDVKYKYIIDALLVEYNKDKTQDLPVLFNNCIHDNYDSLDKDTRMQYYIVYTKIINDYNSNSVNMNKSYNDIIYNTDTMKHTFTSIAPHFNIVLSRYINNKFISYKNISSLSDTIDISDIIVEGLYRADVYVSSHLSIRYYLYNYKDIDKQDFIYSSILDSINNYILATTNYYINSNYANFTEDELNVFKVQKYYSPINIMIPSPVISLDDFNNINVQFRLYDCIKQFKDPVYLVVSEKDLLGQSIITPRKYEITDDTLTINMYKESMSYENYYFYIVNSLDIPISYMSVFDTSNVEDTYQTDKCDKQLIFNRINRILPQLDSSIKEDVKSSLDYVLYKNDISRESLIDYAILYYIQNLYSINNVSVIRSLYLDLLLHEDINSESIINDNIIIKPRINSLEFPIGSKYIVQKIGYSRKNEDPIYSFYHTDSNLSTSIICDDFDYNVFLMYNEDTIEKCIGFIIISYENNTIKYNTYNVNIKVESGDTYA